MLKLKVSVDVKPRHGAHERRCARKRISNRTHRQDIIFQAPTGAHKTVNKLFLFSDILE